MSPCVTGEFRATVSCPRVTGKIPRNSIRGSAQTRRSTKMCRGFCCFTWKRRKKKNILPETNGQFAPENMAVWPENERILSRTSIFRCELLVSGRVTHQKEGFQKNWLNANWIPIVVKFLRKKKSLPDVLVGTKINKKQILQFDTSLKHSSPVYNPSFWSAFRQSSLVWRHFRLSKLHHFAQTSKLLTTTVLFIKQAESSQLLPSTCPYSLPVFFGKFFRHLPFWMIFEIQDHGRSIHPQEHLGPHPWKKKNEERWALKSPFFFESWSLKMRGFFYHLFPLTKILMCEEKNGFLQNSLETYESFDFFSRRKSGKLRTRHLACPRWLPRGVDPTSTALHWARQRLHEISGFFVGCPRPKPGFKKSKEWSKVTSLQKGSESW